MFTDLFSFQVQVSVLGFLFPQVEDRQEVGGGVGD